MTNEQYVNLYFDNKNRNINPIYKKEYDKQAEKVCEISNLDDLKLAIFFGVSIKTIHDWVDENESFYDSILSGYNKYPECARKKQEVKDKQNAANKLPHRKASNRAYANNVKRKNPRERIRLAFSSQMRDRIKNKKHGMFRHLDYSLQDLMDHLEARFVPGMTFENYGKVWHIDHIKPNRLFNYESQEDEDFKKCWALSNLQPLFAADNLSKGGRYYGD